MIELDANGCYITASFCCRAIDEAVTAGHDKSTLRWRVSPSQRRAIMHFIVTSCSPVVVDEVVGHGTTEHGMWCGVPFVVDRDISDTGVVLEVITATNPVAILRGLALTK